MRLLAEPGSAHPRWLADDFDDVPDLYELIMAGRIFSDADLFFFGPALDQAGEEDICARQVAMLIGPEIPDAEVA